MRPGAYKYSMNSIRLIAWDTPRLVFLGAACAALLLANGQPASVWLGTTVALAVLVASLRTFWLALFALFPLAFAMHPAPPRIGMQEAVFALFAVVAVSASLLELWRSVGWRGVLRLYAVPGIVASVLVGINLSVALMNDVPLADWLRGLIPFAFLIFALPLTQALRGHPERLSWLALAVTLLAIMMVGHVVGVFLLEGLHRPYWLVADGDVVRRIAEDSLALYPEATGPHLGRITVLLPRATDVLLPAGLVMAVVVAVRAEARWLVRVAAAFALLALLAVLMTLTRSMLLAAGATILLTGMYVVLCWRDRLGRLAGLLTVLLLIGGGTVYTLGLQDIWLYRMGQLMISGQDLQESGQDLQESGQEMDENITSRLEEIRIALSRFRENPILGDGLGSKHDIIYFGAEGAVEQQVAYVHNWPAYFLMSTGALGFIAYTGVLLGPVVAGYRRIRHEPVVRTAVRAGVLTFALYGLFFAVFRLIDFNLLLAAAWAVTLAVRGEGKPA